MLLAPGRRADPGTRRRLDNGRGTFLIRPKRRLDPARDEVRTPAAGGAGTFCNPLDLPYRFKLNRPSRRGAADPTILAYRRRYIMFDSKSVRSPTDSVRRGSLSLPLWPLLPLRRKREPLSNPVVFAAPL